MRKVIATVIAILFVLLFIPKIYLYPLYITIIKPAGESNIDSAASQAMQVSNTTEKLQEIAEWEVKDFENIWNREPNFPPIYKRYVVYWDSTGRIKIRAKSPSFSNDPHWIAYFKVGGCGELASLFCEVANRCELETRVVGTPGEDHAWDEVKVNGEWKHTDPTIYYYNYHGNSNDQWFANPQFYEENWSNISKVFVERTGEDITQKYTDVGMLNILFTAPVDRVSITTLKNGKKRFVHSEEVNASGLKIELGGKIYNVTSEKDLIPFLVSRQDVKEVKVVEGEEASIELSPEKLAFGLFSLRRLLCYLLHSTYFSNLQTKVQKFMNREI